MKTEPSHLSSLAKRFPRSSKYNPEWVVASASGGANALWLTEWLTEALNLNPGMRLLDLGCGRAASSIFLHREFDVQVWAVDLWFDPSESQRRIQDANIDTGVFSIRSDARALPFATEFFDAIVSIDSFVYFGTDDLYLRYLARFVKPGGLLGIAGAGLVCEFEAGIPAHLQHWWEPSMSCLHSAKWWRRHWERAGAVDVQVADTMLDGWRAWLEWQRAVHSDNRKEIDALEADAGRCLGYVRAVARRREGIQLEAPVLSLSTQYSKKTLLRKDRQ